jgi:hypothetical protein
MNVTLLSPQVTAFLDQQSLARRSEIEQLRTLILAACPNLVESIKWNGPNYSEGGKDRLTLRIFPHNQLQLIFHCGTKASVGVEKARVPDSSGLLSWKSADRAVVSFTDSETLSSIKSELAFLIQAWITATREI